MFKLMVLFIRKYIYMISWKYDFFKGPNEIIRTLKKKPWLKKSKFVLPN